MPSLSRFVCSLLLLTLTASAFGQPIREYLGDESVLYAETKQLNQFFRRFNGEENTDGVRLYRSDSLYHSPRLRQFYLNMLFDQSNATLADSLKQAFAREMIRPAAPHYLDFHGGEWLAEVTCQFRYQGVSQTVILFLALEPAEIGSKWVFRQVYFEPFRRLFARPQTEADMVFLHPLSHELDFMNLAKAFREPEQADRFASDQFRPDYLTLFLYELKRGTLKFERVETVTFHFFQIDGWYFQVNDIQRPSPNRGWLITQLLRVPPSQQPRLLDFIFRR